MRYALDCRPCAVIALAARCEDGASAGRGQRSAARHRTTSRLFRGEEPKSASLFLNEGLKPFPFNDV